MSVECAVVAHCRAQRAVRLLPRGTALHLRSGEGTSDSRLPAATWHCSPPEEWRGNRKVYRLKYVLHCPTRTVLFYCRTITMCTWDAFRFGVQLTKYSTSRNHSSYRTARRARSIPFLYSPCATRQSHATRCQCSRHMSAKLMIAEIGKYSQIHQFRLFRNYPTIKTILQ